MGSAAWVASTGHCKSGSPCMTIWRPGSRAAAPPLMQRLACNLKDGCCGKERPDSAWRGRARVPQFRWGPPRHYQMALRRCPAHSLPPHSPHSPHSFSPLGNCSDQAVLYNSEASCRVCFCCSNATPRMPAPLNTSTNGTRCCPPFRPCA